MGHKIDLFLNYAYEQGLLKELPTPPRPGLEFDKTKHRWVKPESERDENQKQSVSKTFIDGLESQRILRGLGFKDASYMGGTKGEKSVIKVFSTDREIETKFNKGGWKRIGYTQLNKNSYGMVIHRDVYAKGDLTAETEAAETPNNAKIFFSR
jgi:hypothetical protein